jgi:hypothetical protein
VQFIKKERSYNVANFLIQTVEGQIKNDFSFVLVEAIEYQNFFNKGSHDYVLTDIDDMFEHDFTGFIPSGTIQFVKKYLASYRDIHEITPINIPNDLMSDKYLKRNASYCYLTRGENLFDTDKFIKYDIEIKGKTEITNKICLSKIGRYLV